MEQLHAHEVLHMMEGYSYSEASLKEAIEMCIRDSVWGVENVNETPDLDYMVRAATEPDAFYNKYSVSYTHLDVYKRQGIRRA